jgi:membrane protein
VLVFLYMVGVIFMLGAELNAAILKYKVYSVVNQVNKKRKAKRAGRSEPDDAANVAGQEALVTKSRNSG